MWTYDLAQQCNHRSRTIIVVGACSGYWREATRPIPRVTQPMEGKNVFVNLMVKP